LGKFFKAGGEKKKVEVSRSLSWKKEPNKKTIGEIKNRG